MSAEFERRVVPAANGVKLTATLAGPADGPPVVLLHGFPEFWYGWRKQIRPLADAGFRVIALDQRGYNDSDKPPRVADYDVDTLAADVAAVLDGLGHRRAAIVGHDWGGGVGWWLALTRPDRVSRLAVLNCPHPAAMNRRLAFDPGQLARSWYMFAFQLPRLPEWALGRNGGDALARSLQRTSRPGTFSDADLDHYRQAWGRPGALTGMVNWYRAAVRGGRRLPADPTVRVPTLLIWGGRDRFLKRELADESIRFCRRGRLERIDYATHWVQHEEPDRVNRLLLDFLSDPAADAEAPRWTTTATRT